MAGVAPLPNRVYVAGAVLVQFRRRCFRALLLMASVGLPALPQAVNGTLLGTVTDVGGGLVAGARVSLTETDTSVARRLVANDSGNYTFADIPPGTYSVTVEHDGFKKEVRRGISVSVNSSVRIDLRLQPGSVNETIEVSGAAPVLQTDRADTGRQIDADTIEELPLGVNRNAQSLLDLVPGTSEASFQHSQFFNASSSLQTQVNGQGRMGNNYQIEGIDNNERTGLLQVLILPAEAIQMVSISTTNHDPELGRGTGAISNWVIKSGTNKIRGAVYSFTQNSAANARTFFNPTVGHLVYNYVGGNIGGPIKKNKLFIFGDYLRTMDHEANTNTLTIPSLPYRMGDLSTGKNTVYDPSTGDPLTGVGREPFPGNVIPASRIDPIATKILGYLPAPNRPFVEATPSNNYFALLPSRKVNDQFDVKMDYTLSDKDRLSGRFSFSHPTTFQAPVFGDAGGPAQGAFQGQGFQKTYVAGISYNRTVSPTLLTEFRFGVSHYHNEAVPSDYGRDDTTKLGIPGVNVNEFTSGFVGISVGNFSSPMTGYSASLPWVRAEANIDIVNSWTKLLKNHTIKFGGDIRRVRDDLLQDQTFSPRGVITFGVNQTSTPNAPGGTGVANNFGSFLLGLPSSVGRDVNTYFPAMRVWQIFGYVADNWAISPKLTATIGLRWEYYPPAVPRFDGGFSNYDFTRNELVIAGIGNNPRNLGMVPRYKQFAPRLGLAYRLNEKTVIRSGYGMSYTPFPDNNYAYNFPVRSNNNYTTTLNAYLPAQDPVTGTSILLGTGFPPIRPVEIPQNGVITNPDINSTYFVVPKDFRNPYVMSWNFSVQRSLPWKLVLDVAYVGTHGVNIAGSYNLNAGYVIGAGSRGQPQYPRTAATTQIFRGFSSNYNSLQVKFDRRFNSGLRMTTAFTYQKAMSVQGGDDGGLSFYIDQRRNYARADFDRTLNYVQSYIYDLPFGRGKQWMNHGIGSKLAGGWNLSGVLSLRSGSPINVTANGNSLNLPGSTQTADLVAPVEILHGINLGNPWFSTSSFAQPTGARFGSLGRNSLNGPGTFGLNGKFGRNFAFHERYRLEIRAEAFNVTNTPQFANPSTSLTSSTYGYITGTRASGTGVNGTGGGRSMQFGGKLSF